MFEKVCVLLRNKIKKNLATKNVPKSAPGINGYA